MVTFLLNTIHVCLTLMSLLKLGNSTGPYTVQLLKYKKHCIDKLSQEANNAAVEANFVTDARHEPPKTMSLPQLWHFSTYFET